MSMKLITACAFVWMLSAVSAGAAPYCAVFPWGKQCEYVTYEDCHRAAGSDGGCEFNPVEDKPAPGTAPYCLVDQVGTQCIYESEPACRMAASIQNSSVVTNAKCVENPNR